MPKHVHFLNATRATPPWPGSVKRASATPPTDSEKERDQGAFLNPGSGEAEHDPPSDAANRDTLLRYPCRTIGCDGSCTLAALVNNRMIVARCEQCARAVRAAREGGDYLDEVLASLRAASPIPLAPPLPDALPCIACRRGTAMPKTLWCSNKCRAKARVLYQRQMDFAVLLGLVLPEKTWRQCFGVRASTHRSRRQRMEVTQALLLGAPSRVERQANTPPLVGPADDDDSQAVRAALHARARRR